jgi:hypothetical protein
MQTTSNLLMIRPVNFSFNAETAVNNAFQVANATAKAQEEAEKEFNKFVTVLQQNGVNITVINDTPEPYTPDSIFPNNWISFHANGRIALYPMFATNRRKERKNTVLEAIKSKFIVTEQLDFSDFEQERLFMEGTGSMVLDHVNKFAYACISPRTHPAALTTISEQLGYKAVVFNSVDDKGQAIYHTNVMMCVADRYSVICLDSIIDNNERQHVTDTIKASDKKIIEISLEQMNRFAGNMLQVHNNKKEKLLVMSSQAYSSLTKEQIYTLQQYNKILHSPLTTIETNGGGSARCMMAEVFLEPRLG